MQSGAVLGPALKAVGLAALVILGLIVPGKGLAEPSSATPRVVEALDSIRNVTRPRQDGYTTVWQGETFVQCHAMSDQTLSCEAAGTAMQPSLAQVLTPDRKQRLTSLGWRLDPSFGAYTQTFPASLSLDQAADRILTALSQAYGADLTRIDVQTRWVAHQACPPRHGPGQHLAGIVDDDPMMAPTSVKGCAYSPPATTAASSAGLKPLTGSEFASTYLGLSQVPSEPAATEVVAEESVVAEPETVREPRARRPRRPRAGSGHRESRAKRSRSGGHSSHRK
jgi:hypothetical protein